jgi:hypothetical protein
MGSFLMERWREAFLNPTEVERRACGDVSLETSVSAGLIRVVVLDDGDKCIAVNATGEDAYTRWTGQFRAGLWKACDVWAVPFNSTTGFPPEILASTTGNADIPFPSKLSERRRAPFFVARPSDRPR